MPWRAALVLDPVAADDLRDDYSGTFRPIDPAAPLLSIDDLSGKRGDGVFETLLVVDGHPQELTAHLERLARSAAQMELPAPRLAQWRQAILALAAQRPAGDAALRITLSRGIDGDDDATAWLSITEVGDYAALRSRGFSLALLERGFDSAVAERAPWLLLGAKTLSYAVNMAATREARRRGADDALFVSSDGVLLEAPLATLLLRIGDRFVTPEPAAGILHGTTQLAVFRHLASRGIETAYETLHVPDLLAADGAWLLSSIWLIAPIRAVDSRPLAVDDRTTRELADHLRTPRD